MKRLLHLIAPATPPTGNVEVDGKALMVRAMIAVLLVNDVTLLFHPYVRRPEYIVLMSLLWALYVPVRWLYVREKYEAATQLFSWVVFTVAAIVILVTTGIRGPGLNSLLLIVVVQWLINGTRAGIGMVFWTGILILVSMGLELSGIGPAQNEPLPLWLYALRAISNVVLIVTMLYVGRVRHARLVEDLREAANNERRAAERAQTFAMALVDIANDAEALSTDTAVGMRRVAQIAGERMRAECVEIWSADPDLHSAVWRADDQDLTQDRPTLSVSDVPRYWDALSQARFLATNDVRQDEDFSEVADYCVAFGYPAILEAPVRVGGRAIGGIAFYRAAGDPHWTPEECQFAAMVADQIGLIELLFENRRSERAVLMMNQSLERRVESRTIELAERTKDLEQFSYIVSHDLRSPLRTIAGFTNILKTDYGEKLDREGTGMLQRVESAAKRMAMMLDGVLAYARIGSRESRVTEVEISPIIRGIAFESRDLAASRLTAIEFDVEDAKVWLDEECLEIALRNLLSNAFKFTRGREGAKVSVKAKVTADGTLTIEISDNGPGFDPSDRERVFKVFERLSNSSEEGTGVGLALVQRAAQRMGGRVTAQSEVGKGATFKLVVPGVRPSASHEA